MINKETDEIPEKFFDDQDEAIQFLVSGKEMGKASKNGKYVATLLKEEPGKWQYLLVNTEDELFVGDHVRPFRCNKENIELFNNGAMEIAKIMQQLEALPADRHKDFIESCAGKEVFGELAYASANSGSDAVQEEPRRGFQGKVIIKEFREQDIQVLEADPGSDGAFVYDSLHIVKIPKDVDPRSISLTDCIRILAEKEEFHRRFFERDRKAGLISDEEFARQFRWISTD